MGYGKGLPPKRSRQSGNTSLLPLGVCQAAAGGFEVPMRFTGCVVRGEDENLFVLSHVIPL